MIIVDGCKSDKEISNFANLEEVLTTVMEDEKWMTGWSPMFS